MMLDGKYWTGKNETETNVSEFEIEEVIEDPGSAILFNDYPPWLLYFAASCCALFMLVGIPGNLITVAALFRTKKLRNATAVFIMNLSLSDLMFCCFNLPLATSTFWHSSWMYGPLLCRLFPFLRYGLVAVSLFTILNITINRYVMISHPRTYPKLYRPRYLILMVLLTWVFGFGALVATWLEIWGRFGLDPAIGSCSILPDKNGRSPKEFLFIIAFLAPCLAIVICYARIFYIVRKTAAKSRCQNVQAAHLVKSNLEVKYKKSDSALGSSYGITVTTATETNSSPTSEKEQKLQELHSKTMFPILKQSSEHLLCPPQIKYDESSEEYGSSRSESPCEKNKFNVFRRESRFRSDRGRNFESGKMSAKDKKLLKMILVIFCSFLVCYLPITISKTLKEVVDYRGLNIAGYILIYLTTCINPVIYVVMSSEYRCAYKNVLLCRTELISKESLRARKKRRRSTCERS